MFFCKRCLLLWPATVAADAVAYICVVVDAAGVFLCLPLCDVDVVAVVAFVVVYDLKSFFFFQIWKYRIQTNPLSIKNFAAEILDQFFSRKEDLGRKKWPPKMPK